LVSLLIGKALVWSVALGSGTSGGVLAPLLMMGGAMGALLGHWLPVGDASLWALAGMAGMMAGMMNLPFAGIIFVLELSHDLNSLPVLLVSSTASFGVSVLLMRRSILTEKLARRGQHVAREYSVDALELTRVGEVMDKDVPAIPSDLTIGELSERIANGGPAIRRRQGTIIVDAESNLAGIITRGDVVRALQRDPTGGTPVLEAGKCDLVVSYPDEPLSDAVGRMLRHNVGRLPVVERNAPRQVVGYLGRSSILSARWRRQQEEEVRERGDVRIWPTIRLGRRDTAEPTP
jgi:CBS domain-containing protein